MNKNSLAVIIVAGGNGSRMGSDIPKQFLKIGDREIIEYTLDSFIKSGVSDKIVVVCHKDYQEHMHKIISSVQCDVDVEIVVGGQSRQESVVNGLERIKNYKYVMIHDAVRCCIHKNDILKICSYLRNTGSCALGVRVKDTIKRADEAGNIIDTVDRECLWQIQTPQAFVTEDILKAHKNAIEQKRTVTDDCALMEHDGGTVRIIEGSYDNIKITTPDDMKIAEAILKRQ